MSTMLAVASCNESLALSRPPWLWRMLVRAREAIRRLGPTGAADSVVAGGCRWRRDNGEVVTPSDLGRFHGVVRSMATSR